jgi:hypothetical protein
VILELTTDPTLRAARQPLIDLMVESRENHSVALTVGMN